MLTLNGKKPRSPRDFTNARRAKKGKPPIQYKKLTEKQEMFMAVDRVARYWLEAVYKKTGVKPFFSCSDGGKNYIIAKNLLKFLTEKGVKKQIDLYLYSEKYEEYGVSFSAALSEHSINTIILKQK